MSTGINDDATDRDYATVNMLNTDDEYDQNSKTQNLNFTAPKKEKERAYYADWIRAIAIHFVIMVHCVQCNIEATDIYNPSTYARIPYNEEVIQKANGFIKSLTQCGIPMFFYVSGMSLTYWDTQKKGFGVYAVNKFMRLMVPFFVAVVVILVPRLYITQSYQIFARPYPDEIDRTEDNFFKYYIAVFPHIWKCLSWLWFLPALYINTIVNFPLLAWSQRRIKGKPIEASQDGKIIAMLLLIMSVWIIPSIFAAPDLVPMVFVNIAFYFAYFGLQMLLLREGGHKYGLLIKAIGPLCSFALNVHRDGKNQDAVYGFLASINYDMIFMAQGLIDGIFSKELQKNYDDNSKTLMMPGCFMLYGLNLALCSPTIYKDEGDLFSYPLYVPLWAQCFHSLGSFYLVYFLTWYMKTVSNQKFNANVYNIIVGGSMWAYLSHYLWIVISVAIFVLPNKLDFSVAAPVTFIGTEILCLLSQFFLQFIMKTFCKGSKRPAHLSLDVSLRSASERPKTLLDQGPDTLICFLIQTVENAGPTEDGGTCMRFFKRKTHPEDLLKDKFSFAVFGLGDSNLLLDRQTTTAKDCNQCAQELDSRLAAIGGNRHHELGISDERTGLQEVEPWIASFWSSVEK